MARAMDVEHATHCSTVCESNSSSHNYTIEMTWWWFGYCCHVGFWCSIRNYYRGCFSVHTEQCHNVAIEHRDHSYNTMVTVLHHRHYDNSFLNAKSPGIQTAVDCVHVAIVSPTVDTVYRVWWHSQSLDRNDHDLRCNLWSPFLFGMWSVRRVYIVQDWCDSRAMATTHKQADGNGLEIWNRHLFVDYPRAVPILDCRKILWLRYNLPDTMVWPSEIVSSTNIGEKRNGTVVFQLHFYTALVVMWSILSTGFSQSPHSCCCCW